MTQTQPHLQRLWGQCAGKAQHPRVRGPSDHVGGGLAPGRKVTHNSYTLGWADSSTAATAHLRPQDALPGAQSPANPLEKKETSPLSKSGESAQSHFTWTVLLASGLQRPCHPASAFPGNPKPISPTPWSPPYSSVETKVPAAAAYEAPAAVVRGGRGPGLGTPGPAGPPAE